MERFFLSLFHEHSQFTGQQGKREAVSLTPLDHSHRLHKRFDTSHAITGDISSLRIASSQT